MTIIVFLVDTSASMCQRALVNGVQKTYLDIAKGAVETFLKFRQRSQDCMGDRYMLLTFEDPPNNVKAGWKENHATFMNELKNLQSNGLTSMGEALKNAFDLLNLNRMQSGIDTYGQGRCPFYLEPSVIIVLTDGGKYAFRNGVHQEIILPLHAQMPGTKLTKEPFRWDQRLFSLVLRMPGNRVEERADGKVPHDDSMIEKMCEVTGGRSYKIKSHYVLNQCIESLVQKVQPGVVIHFDQLIANGGDGGGASELQFQSTKRMIYVPKQHPSQKTFPVGYWPIPEPYWPDPKLTSLPPRDAHPKIKIISPCCDEPQVLRNFPIDKYELEASPLTLQILSKKESNKVWPLIVSTGMQGEMPFGYLKPNSTLPIVHLYVLPYNYQMLLPLINDLFHKFNLNPPNDWVYKFTNYVKTIPQYYCPFLRRALATTPNVPYQLVQYILPENLDSYLCPAVANYLKQMKNTAKQDQENLCLRVLKQLKQPKPAYHQLETAKLTGGQQLKRDIVTHPMLKDTFTKMHMEIASFDSYTIVIPSIIQTAATKNYRNPYDIPRRDLIDEIARMRENFFHLPTSGIHVFTKDSGHCLPISDMGNYQEYLKNKETPLRELEPTNVRQHMFGNPYKKDKNMVMVDEADLNDLAPMKASGLPGPHPGSSHMKKSLEQGTVTRVSRKRKAGPIRKDYVFKRSAMELASSSSSSGSSSASGSLSGDESSIGDPLLTDDESGSELSGSGSDTEDDTEGCLVMALDPLDDPPGELVVPNHHREPLPEGAGVAGGAAAPTEATATTATAAAPGGTGAHPSMAEVAVAEVKVVIRRAGSPGIVGEKEQSRADESVAYSPKKQTHEQQQQPDSKVGAHVAEAEPAKKVDRDATEPVSVDGAGERDDGKKESLLVEREETDVLEEMEQEGEETAETNVRQAEQVAEQAIAPRPDGSTDGGVKPHIELTEQRERMVVEQAEQAAEEANVPMGALGEEQAAADGAAPPRPESVQADDHIDTSHERVRAEAEQSAAVRLQADQTVQPSPSAAAEEPAHSDAMEVDAEPDRAAVEPALRAEEPKQAADPLAEPTKSLTEPAVSEPAPQLQAQPQEQRPTSRHASVVQWGMEASAADAADVLRMQEQEQQEQQQEQQQQEQQHELQQEEQQEEQQQQQQQQMHEQRPAAPSRHPAVSQWNLEAGNDLTDVLKISNILKTCHNGSDSDRGKDGHYDDGPPTDRPTVISSTNSGGAHQAGGGTAPDTEPVMVLANGLVSAAMNGGCDGAVQPTLNWYYPHALYACVEDEQELERIEETNLRTRSIVYRDIRRPGRDYAQLLKHLELVEGSRATRKHFVDACVQEARRFRRHRMVECIQEWWARSHAATGMKRSRHKQQQQQQEGDGGSTNTYYAYGNSDGLLEDEQEHALTPDNLFFAHDAGASAYGSSSETYRSTTPPGAAAYLNNSIGGPYGTIEFSHNNHFAEAVHVPFS
uniref:VWFA domain-containing protein n=1 Tax=Anopheles coluzzii TaxID=1518534 RepID=A0A6E8UYR6_ANOCL|nr:integrator complex subunit 6 [Anopheles coluzzii]XP_040238277.2 integrator complex subunit 6 [Anopheles coluzzii]XP_040238284.2 integrator complex subunit 6 [Anopheles coluzzii]XP_040238294.2 integrator complex subunit 6 [Anopheles coluzzii]